MDGNTTDFNPRILCSDGSCKGVIGAEGKCKECGKPHIKHEHDDRQTNPKVGENINCPTCGFDQWKLASVVYEEGAGSTSNTAAGIGTNFDNIGVWGGCS